MKGFSSKCPQLLDLLPKDQKEWAVRRGEEKTGHDGFSEEKKLELSLDPPGGEWAGKYSSRERDHHESILSQKRTAPAPVVGWPPIRSFRKNIASGSSSKLSSESLDSGPMKGPGGPKPVENGLKSLFVKINMDGIPIGRKVDLKKYDGYDKLSFAVDELFRDLLACYLSQSDPCAGGMKDKEDEEKAIGCLLDGSGEYTLVYEDNEGDKMLVGDVPWPMFVSTVKRLRVLKSSELSTLSRGSKQGKLVSMLK